MGQDQEVLETIIKAIVYHPEEVKTIRSVDDMGVLLRLWVAKKDMGLVLGQRGVHASSIKLILKLVGFQNGARVSVKIEEPYQKIPDSSDSQ